MSRREDTLRADIAAVNKANSYANEIYPQLIEAFQSMVGSKIEKVDGSFLKSVAAIVPKFEYSNKLSVYRLTSKYTLGFVVKVCEHIVSTDEKPSHGCVYHETTLYIGDLKNGVLSSINDKTVLFKTDYKFDEINRLRAAYKEAQDAANALKSELYLFGE